MKRPSPRWSVASRTVAGTLGAYALTSLLVVALSRLLARGGINGVEAVTTASLASFLLFAIIAITTFHARSATRAWAWQIGTALPAVILILLLSG